MSIEKLYTIEEAAVILKKKTKTIYNLISARQLTAITGRPVMIPESAVKEFFRKRTKKALI